MIIFVEITENECVKNRYPCRKRKWPLYCAIAWKRYQIEYKSVNSLEKKWHTGFQLVHWSVTGVILNGVMNCGSCASCTTCICKCGSV